MIIALFPNLTKEQSVQIASNIAQFLSKKGVQVAADDTIAPELKALPLSSIKLADINYSISIGGDGTILRLAHRYPDLHAPIIGINFGGLGFMADIPLSDVYSSLQDVLDGKVSVQERLMIQGTTVNNEKCLAVNEIVVHRAQNPCLIELALYVDNVYLNTFSADGIIISTPSGSTAYSLAAGGPILSPQLQALVITPICPHTISNRPIVLMPNKEIRIEYISKHSPVEITYDGFPKYTMKTGDHFYISLAEQKFRLVSFPNHDYFSTLRSKLGWAGKLKA
jgi:NAD+ kinase